MGNSRIAIFVIIAIIMFTSGIFIASYEIFPYNILKSLKNDFFDESKKDSTYYENDVNTLIHLQDVSSLQKAKDNLLEFLWKQTYLPEKLPDAVEFDIDDPRFSSMKNLESIDKITINMEHDVNSISYLFKPLVSNNELILYHQGHRGDFFEGKNTIQFFLDNNYSVLAFSMPLLGMNDKPIIHHSEFGRIQLTTHNHFELLESNSFTPISLFVEPPVVALNHIEENFNFNSINTVGLSGGGWTIMMLSAIDSRIDQSFSIAGSYPIFLRNDPENFGDYEQHNLSLYKITNYLDLYTLASYGENRKFIQIFNKFDPCCFHGESFFQYKDAIKKNISSFENGHFDIFFDDTHKEHKISNNALGKIINSLKND
jgi:hypothetical protein